jgi:large subunit ribosomal protein L18
MIKKEKNRLNRHRRIRARVSGTSTKPRLVVFRSLNYTYAQLIDDETGKVLVAASDAKKGVKKDAAKKDGTKTVRAKKTGETIAKMAQEKGIKTCVFDRNGYKYHGRVKSLADGAREGGLQF